MEHVKDTKEQRKKKGKRVESKHPQKRAVKRNNKCYRTEKIK